MKLLAEFHETVEKFGARLIGCWKAQDKMTKRKTELEIFYRPLTQRWVIKIYDVS